MKFTSVITLLGSGALVLGQDSYQQPLAVSDPFYPSPWMNPHAHGWEEAYAKAKQFVSQLTLMEKVNLTTGVGWISERCVGNTGSVPRLGLRGFCLQDGPVGLRFTDRNSVFPSGQLTAATFDRSLMRRRARAMGDEAKGKGVDILLQPVAGPIGRMPAGGRNWEGFSPDPVLSGVGMYESVIGIQEAGVVATAKHFVGNEQEHFRQDPEARGYGFVNVTEALSSNIDDKTMHELYMWPFADAVRAGVGAVMCVYTQANNSYGCQNSKLMNNLLKDELGFQGFVMSDWQAQHTGVASAAAGLDMTMPGDTMFNTGVSYWGTNLTIGVLNGTVAEWRLDDMAMRIMAAWFKVGGTIENGPITFSSWSQETFDYIHPNAKKGPAQVNFHTDVRKDHGRLIREVAAKGTVLLKNTGSLPLTEKTKFLAVIGEDAGPNLAGPNGCDNRGCNNGTLGAAWGSGTSNYPYLITPDAALQSKAIDHGAIYQSILHNHQTSQIKALVTQADVTALVFVNANSGEGFINVDNNKGDRKNLTLWGDGDALVKNVSSWCNNTIVVIHSVGPVTMEGWYDSPNVTAIVWAGLPGQESGRSIVDVLYGHVNPSGKTPFTWGPTIESYGTAVMYEPNGPVPQQDFTEGVFIDYRHFDAKNITPIFEFGFGLSYTTFAYSDLKIEKSGAGAYTPTTGFTPPAPTFGQNASRNWADYVFPNGTIEYIYQFIYPYLNVSDPKAASADPRYGQTADKFLPPRALDGSPQPLLPSADKTKPGGHRQLYDIMYSVSATVKNTGAVTGAEVPQLYVSLGGPKDPKVVLRAFERVTIDAGKSRTVTFRLDRRDLSEWDVASQNWVISKYPKKVYVGSSSRKLPLSGDLV